MIRQDPKYVLRYPASHFLHKNGCAVWARKRFGASSPEWVRGYNPPTAAAYPLSRKSYSIRSPLMLFIAITMYFSGGLVPQFLLVNNLGLYNTRWVIVLLGAVNVTQLVIARVFFQTTISHH